jgi:hypothetical protein
MTAKLTSSQWHHLFELYRYAGEPVLVDQMNNYTKVQASIEIQRLSKIVRRKRDENWQRLRPQSIPQNGQQIN